MHSYKYPRPAVTVDVAVFCPINNDWQVLLIERGKEPFRGTWALPGGFVDMEETLEQACLRELEEETGLKLSSVRQFKVFDAPNRDPRERILSVVFYAMVDNAIPTKASDDASAAKWFLLSSMPPLAFDHAEILESLVKHLRNQCLMGS